MDRSDQLSKVLNRCDQQILDRLFDQRPPASALETMSVGGVSKTAFQSAVAGDHCAPAYPSSPDSSTAASVHRAPPSWGQNVSC